MSTVTVYVPIEVEAPAVVTMGDVLRRAADILEEFDWQQRAMGGRGAGAMCALGAYIEASGDLPGRVGAWPAPWSTSRLVNWNDEPGRTKADVVAKLREIAAM